MPQPRGRAPGQGARARQHLVRGGGRNRAFPLDDRVGAVEILRHRAAAAREAARRATSTTPARRRCPSGRRVEHPQPVVRDRSARRQSRTGKREGVLFPMGTRFGGHALYVKDNRLHYVNNFVGSDRAAGRRRPRTSRPARSVVLSAVVREGRRRSPTARPARSSLYHGDTKVGEGGDQDAARRVRDRRRRASTSGADAGEPITDDYPGEAPYTLHRRHDRPGRDRRERRAVRRPRARGRPDARCANDDRTSSRKLERHADPRGDRRLRRRG